MAPVSIIIMVYFNMETGQFALSLCKKKRVGVIYQPTFFKFASFCLWGFHVVEEPA